MKEITHSDKQQTAHPFFRPFGQPRQASAPKGPDHQTLPSSGPSALPDKHFSAPVSFKGEESDQLKGPSTIPSFAKPAPRLSPPLPFGENHPPSTTTVGTFNGNAFGLTKTRLFAEVKQASLELFAKRRMTFHHLRLSAALNAFQSDKSSWNRKKWWMQNLELELNNALMFVGLCVVQDKKIIVPNLICLLAHAFQSKTDSYVLSISQLWEEVYSSDELDSLTDRLHSAWWAHPGGGDACSQMTRHLSNICCCCHRAG